MRRAPTPEARARARLMTSVRVRVGGRGDGLSRCSPCVLVLLGRPGLTLDDPTARHSALGGEPTALLFWFARLTAAVIALAVLATRRARPAERWLRSGLAALVVVVALGGLAVLLAAVTETVTGSSVACCNPRGGGGGRAVGAGPAGRTEWLAERLLYGTRATPAGVLAEVSELTRRTGGRPDRSRPGPRGRRPRRSAPARSGSPLFREGMSDRTSRWRTPRQRGGESPTRRSPSGTRGRRSEPWRWTPRRSPGGDQRRRLVADVADGLGGVLARAPGLEIELERQLRAARRPRRADRGVAPAAGGRRWTASRRGIERNLHDGAQHHLVSLRLTLGLVEHLASAGRLDGARERSTLLLEQLDTAETVLAETASGVSSATLRRLGPVGDVAGGPRRGPSRRSSSTGEGVGRHGRGRRGGRLLQLRWRR